MNAATMIRRTSLVIHTPVLLSGASVSATKAT